MFLSNISFSLSNYFQMTKDLAVQQKVPYFYWDGEFFNIIFWISLFIQVYKNAYKSSFNLKMRQDILSQMTSYRHPIFPQKPLSVLLWQWFLHVNAFKCSLLCKSQNACTCLFYINSYSGSPELSLLTMLHCYCVKQHFISMTLKKILAYIL